MQAHLPARPGGFTMIEVLVAMFVLAVGVVGASAAQLAAQRTRQHAALTSEAALLALSLTARMQANAQVASLPDGANPYLPLDYKALDASPPAGGAACFGAGSCDPLALGAFDLRETRLALHRGFPSGRIAVCRDGAPWDADHGRYRWACSGDATAPVAIKIGWHGTQDGPGYVLLVAR
ncbi:type IV pilus modification protein PilV [Massilia oculi]|uniref:Type IV pilus modification protein PilV n=1 Tax=Massilia oculi TaxID=945844 RepID=A0A2S2DET3_9BURK|nr:type IV pilus modification protein PilV [Massilia oculi]AWL03854.1 type IV pilus modification protein PilV [Massilia oculi]